MKVEIEERTSQWARYCLVCIQDGETLSRQRQVHLSMGMPFRQLISINWTCMLVVGYLNMLNGLSACIVSCIQTSRSYFHSTCPSCIAMPETYMYLIEVPCQFLMYAFIIALYVKICHEQWFQAAKLITYVWCYLQTLISLWFSLKQPIIKI